MRLTKIFQAAFISISRMHFSSAAAAAAINSTPSPAVFDNMYPGTAVQRMLNVRQRAVSLSPKNLSVDWDDSRRLLLWAAGLKDLPNAPPGQGYTGHSFNDWNHVDATCMLGTVAHNENEGRVEGIQQSNKLGAGIVAASIGELGEGGTWSTCMMGCNSEPPRDVAHIQFQSRVAFKLVWCPPSFNQYVLVDDDGELLTWGAPTGRLPSIRDRMMNYNHVRDSKYGKHAYERNLLSPNDSCEGGSGLSEVETTK